MNTLSRLNTNSLFSRYIVSRYIMLACLALFSLLSHAQGSADQPVAAPQPVIEPAVPGTEVALSVEELKKQVIKLNRDLFILEEDLLFPANTQFVVYLSFATGKFLQLDSITLKVDDEVVAAHLYTENQLQALKRGGMQRLHMGNLKTGEHEITAIVHGIGPNKKPYKLGKTTVFEKKNDLKALEIRIEDQSANYQPSINIVEWEK